LLPASLNVEELINKTKTGRRYLTVLENDLILDNVRERLDTWQC